MRRGKTADFPGNLFIPPGGLGISFLVKRRLQKHLQGFSVAVVI